MTAFDNASATIHDVALQLLNSHRAGGKKTDTRIYWKRPVIKPDGKRDDAPGWIIIASDSEYRLMEFIQLGWTPLFKYGHVQEIFRDDAIDLVNQGKLPANHPDQYGIWGRILSHREGPAEFPVEQVVTFRWYDPELCPVPGVQFPQLAGQKITEYDCPECNQVSYAKPVHLARHLRNTHDYDRQEIAALGEELGINFGKEQIRSGRIERVYEYTEAQAFAREVSAAPEAPAVQPPLVEQRKPLGRSGLKRSNSGTAKGTDAARERMAKVRAARHKQTDVSPEPQS